MKTKQNIMYGCLSMYSFVEIYIMIYHILQTSIDVIEKKIYMGNYRRGWRVVVAAAYFFFVSVIGSCIIYIYYIVHDNNLIIKHNIMSYDRNVFRIYSRGEI